MVPAPPQPPKRILTLVDPAESASHGGRRLLTDVFRGPVPVRVQLRVLPFSKPPLAKERVSLIRTNDPGISLVLMFTRVPEEKSTPLVSANVELEGKIDPGTIVVLHEPEGLWLPACQSA